MIHMFVPTVYCFSVFVFNTLTTHLFYLVLGVEQLTLSSILLLKLSFFFLVMFFKKNHVVHIVQMIHNFTLVGRSSRDPVSSSGERVEVSGESC